ncbi:MAG: hypothetical protein GC159_20595 [Phycisphaera sp.]|nr:hypothetical protein [Phycisphaera sp.]
MTRHKLKDVTYAMEVVRRCRATMADGPGRERIEHCMLQLATLAVAIVEEDVARRTERTARPTPAMTDPVCLRLGVN